MTIVNADFQQIECSNKQYVIYALGCFKKNLI